MPDSILSAMLPGMEEPPDDVTLLLVQIPGPPVSSVSTQLPPEPQSAGAARRFIATAVGQWGYPGQADTASLLVSELVTNAVCHTRAPLGLRLHLTEHEIITEVTDDSMRSPRRYLAGPDDESGRGPHPGRHPRR